MLTIMLSTALMMDCFIALREVLSSSTTGFFSLESSISLSRRSLTALYCPIWFSMLMSLMPVLDGIRSISRVGSVR